MPNKKSAIKHLRQTEKLTRHNDLVKRNIKEIIKSGKKAIAAGKIEKEVNKLIYSLQQAVDKAVKSGIIKENTGNRKKARFAAMIRKAGVKLEAIKSEKKTEAKEKTA